MRVSNKHIAIFALIISNIVWGGAAPIFKWSLENIEPFTLAFLRFFIASLILWPFALPHIALRIKDIPKIILLAFIGIFMHISFFFLGLKVTSSINVPIIGASTPIFIMIVALLFLGEKPKRKVVFGTILSLLGTIFITISPLFQGGQDGTIIGNLLILLSALCLVSYTILLKKFNLPYPPLVLIFWTFFAGAIMFFPFFAMEMQHTNLLQNLDTRAIVGILYGALSASTLAYLCYDLGIKYLKANEVGIFFYIDPIATIVIAMPLLGEKITLPYILGALTIFAGIFIAEGKFHYRPLHPHLLSKKSN
jgi:drug/metabolite transporter (DMT)-like permease